MVPVHGGATLQSIRTVWRDPKLSEAIKHAIDWYTESLTSRHQATIIISAQAGLELMSWLRLVYDGGLSETGFNGLTAADQLRLALEFAHVPLTVPSSLLKLSAAAKEAQADGPGAITEIRNGLVHPKAKQHFTDYLAVFEGGRLAIHFLQLLLLHRLNYVGQILDWTTGTSSLVPWAAPSSAS
jgi:hypothetical protein